MMSAAKALGLWVLLTLLTLHAAQLGRAEESSSKLNRLERLLMEQQAQWEKERDILREETQAQFAKQQAQIESLMKENRLLKTSETVIGNDEIISSSDHPQKIENSIHTQQIRSDDGGPLEVVVNRLAQDVIQLSGKVQALKTSEATRGSTFVQWGSSTCSSSSQLVYEGYLGGSRYSYTGAGANTLCLTTSPKLQDIPSGVSNFAYVDGGEYETPDLHFNEDPVCALCWSPLTATMMVPGTTDCPLGWTAQYSGYLMAGYYNHAAASEFICVDRKRESRTGTRDNKEGRLLYYSVTQCGSLPCGPYENSKIVTCVVCSK